ncbi:MAG: fused MFS/spermidine synthase [Candidatus Glassbacteria bacterium]
MAARGSRGLVASLYLLFFLSGISGLIYQTVWLRMFALVLGNSLHSAGTVFAAFMGGMALGAWLFGGVVKRTRDPLLLYIAIEAGIAVTALAAGLVIPHLIDIFPGLQRSLAGSPLLTTLWRITLSVLVLVLPTALIGATLPVLGHFITVRVNLSGRRIGALYGWNTLGAVAGCVATGFWLLRLAGVYASLLSAVGINLLVALAALTVRAVFGRQVREITGGLAAEAGREKAPVPADRRWNALLLGVAGISGACGLAYEVVWSRFLSYILHNDIYAYYLMLSTVLLGIGAGSLVYAWRLDRRERPARLLGRLQIALALAVPACYLACARLYLDRDNLLFNLKLTGFFRDWLGDSFLTTVAVRYVYTFIVMLVPAVILGMVFPLVCRLYVTRRDQVGSQAGTVYAVNTAGAVAGSLAAGFLLVPSLGVQASLFFCAALNLAAGLIVLREATRLEKLPALKTWVPAGAAAVLCVLLAALPDNQIRNFSLKDRRYTEPVFYEEGLTGTVTVVQDRVNGIKTLSINAIGEVENSFTGMQTFKVLGHLPLLLHAGEPREVLMVTFGGGIASGAVARHPIHRLDVVELEPAVVRAARAAYSLENLDVAADSRVRIHLGDGRHFLAAADTSYDVIISDATNPASSDSWLLYTIEFYRLCRERLTGRGVMAQWLPVHSGSPETYRTVVKTFQAVFPHTTIWFTKDYTILTGTPEPFSLDYAEFVRRLSLPYVKSDLEPWCLDRPLELLDCFLLGEETARRMSGSVRVSTDDLPLYQFATEVDPAAGILAMLGRNRERIAPYLTGLDSLQKLALADSLEPYFRSQAYLLQRNFPAGRKANPTSCKHAVYDQEYGREVDYNLAILHFDPDNYRIQTRVGIALAGHGEYQKAREVFTSMLAKNSGDGSIYTTLGNIDFKMGDYRQAAVHFRRALELGRKDTEVLINLGLSLCSTDNCQEGLGYLQEAARLDSASVDANFYLGLGYNALGRRDQEFRQYEKVLALDPDHVETLVNLGLIYLEKKDFSKAGGLFERAVSLDPSQALAWQGLGRALFLSSRFAEAAGAFRTALAKDPTDRLSRRYLELLEKMAPPTAGRKAAK